MALNVGLKIVHIAAILLYIVFTAKAQILHGSSSLSTCEVKKFNESVKDEAKKGYGKCYVFAYNFSLPQVSGKKFSLIIIIFYY